jgi:serine/threonine protein kinase
MLKEIKSNKDIFDVSHKKKGFKISDEARSFISECLVVESQKRLTWTNIIKHKLFKKYGEESEQLTSTIRRTVSLNVKEM